MLVTLENWCFIDVLRTFGSYNPFIIALSELRFTRTYFFKKNALSQVFNKVFYKMIEFSTSMEIS